jgi:hypothetical protein
MHVSTGRPSADSRRRPDNRTIAVWGGFAAMITIVAGVLAVTDNEAPRTGFLAASIERYGEEAQVDPVFLIDAPLDRQRWTGIVIHHLGLPAADVDSIHHLHQSYGYHGLGYHFVVGNGRGLGDGVVHVGYRWNDQLPGVHTAGPDANLHNQRSIGICLVGDGDLQPFSEKQFENLLRLVQRLQRELDIPADRVVLHRDVNAAIADPGRFFPEARFREQLLGGRR